MNGAKNYSALAEAAQVNVAISDGPGTTTTLAAPSSIAYGETLTLIATVSKTSQDDPGAPAGTVQFKQGGENLGEPVALVGGTATKTVNGLELIGSPYTFTAEYASTNGFSKSTGTKLVAVTAVSLSGASVSVGGGPYTYTGSAITPDSGDVTVTLNGNELVYGSDYIVELTNNVNAGTATLTANGAGNYGGSVSASFTIRKKTLTWNDDGTVQSKPFDGTTDATVASVPTLNGVFGGDTVTIVTGTVAFESAGVGTGIAVTADGWGIEEHQNYYAPAAQPVFANGAITAASISGAVVAIGGTYEYTGSAVTPVPEDVTVTLGGRTLAYGTDYTFTASSKASLWVMVFAVRAG